MVVPKSRYEKNKEVKQKSFADLISAYRRLQAKCQLLRTSNIGQIFVSLRSAI